VGASTSHRLPQPVTGISLPLPYHIASIFTLKNNPRNKHARSSSPCYLLHGDFFLGLFFNLKRKASYSSEISVDFQSTTRRSITQARSLEIFTALEINTNRIQSYKIAEYKPRVIMF
jgi:hypothetical protein